MIRTVGHREAPPPSPPPVDKKDKRQTLNFPNSTLILFRMKIFLLHKIACACPPLMGGPSSAYWLLVSAWLCVAPAAKPRRYQKTICRAHGGDYVAVLPCDGGKNHIFDAEGKTMGGYS